MNKLSSRQNRKIIPVFKPCYDDKELSALKLTFDSGWLGLGPKTALFEEKFAELVGTPYAVAVNSATAALHLALCCLTDKGCEVITTPMTFVSTNHAILYNDAIPVFCDVEPDTMNIDAGKVEQLITPNTKAVLCVHYGGRSCDMDALVGICAKHGLSLVEDCAHAAGGGWNDRMLGSIGQMGCFSFHAVKNMATGDGGMITTSNKAYCERLKKLRWMGITTDTFARGGARYSWQYDVEEVGFKCHMNDITATLGLAQLDKLESMNARRREITALYDAELAGIGDIELLAHRHYQTTNAAHNYVIKTNSRDELNAFLKEKGISTGVHYYPNHLYDVYKPYYRECPVAEREWKRLLTLPLFPSIEDEDVNFIVESIGEFFQ